MNYRNVVEFAFQNLLASPGAIVMQAGRVFQIPTLVPRRKPDGSCIFLDENDRCRIHEVSPFGCFSMDTEVLTPEGWTTRESLSLGTMVLTFNTATEEMEWQQINQLIDHPAGTYPTMLESESLGFRVTPDHGVWYAWRRRARAGGGRTGPPLGELVRGPWRRRPARNFTGKTSAGLRVPVAAKYRGKGVPYSDDFLRLLGWFIADGSFSFDKRAKSERVPLTTFSQSAPNVHRITSLLDALGYRYKVSIFDRTGVERRIPATGQVLRASAPEATVALATSDAAALWAAVPHKRLPWSFLEMSDGQFACFLEGLVGGDGTWYAKGETRLAQHDGEKYRGVVCQKDPRLLDLVQALCVLHGYRSALSRSREEPPLYRLTFRRTTDAFLQTPLREVPNDEAVWCLKVDNEAVVCRRRGVALVMSNCAFFDAHQSDLEANARSGRGLQEIARHWVRPFSNAYTLIWRMLDAANLRAIPAHVARARMIGNSIAIAEGEKEATIMKED